MLDNYKLIDDFYEKIKGEFTNYETAIIMVALGEALEKNSEKSKKSSRQFS